MFTEDLVYVLEQAGVGTFGSTIVVGPLGIVPRQLPSGEPVIVLYETGGTSPDLVHNLTTAPGYTNPGAQVAVHGVDYQETLDKAQEAYDAFFAVRNQYIGSGETLPWYLWIRPTQEPFPLGPQSQGVIRIAFNVTARRRA